MVNQAILNIIQAYLQIINESGIQTKRAVLFGSWARNEARPESDIDLLVIAPEFDGQKDRKLISQLWRLRVAIPDAWRIEPIACGERQWLEDDASAMIEMARREGQMIELGSQN